jgi:hypothetical protein
LVPSTASFAVWQLNLVLRHLSMVALAAHPCSQSADPLYKPSDRLGRVSEVVHLSKRDQHPQEKYNSHYQRQNSGTTN